MPKPNTLVKNELICQAIKCPDCLADDCPPAWCCQVGMPAEVAVVKCPKVNTEMGGKFKEEKCKDK
jgi:hypothetical protein